MLYEFKAKVLSESEVLSFLCDDGDRTLGLRLSEQQEGNKDLLSCTAGCPVSERQVHSKVFFLLTQLHFSSGSFAFRGLGGGAGWS